MADSLSLAIFKLLAMDMGRPMGFERLAESAHHGGATKERINIVSDGGRPLLDALYVGDERLVAALRARFGQPETI